MLTLKAEKRNPDEKAKKLRRDGFITGVLYPFNMITAVAVVGCTASSTAVLPQPQRETTRAAIREIAKMIFFIRKGSFRQALKSKEKL